MKDTKDSSQDFDSTSTKPLTFFWALALQTSNLSRARWCKITHGFAHALIDDSLSKSDGSLQFLYKYWWHKLLSFLTLDGSRLSAKRDLDCAFSLHEGIKAVIRLGWTDLSIEKKVSSVTTFGDYFFWPWLLWLHFSLVSNCNTPSCTI